MKITITQQQLETCDLTHVHGGNGFVMVEDLDKEYCRVAACGAGRLGYLVMIAAKDRLSASPVKEWDESSKAYVLTGKLLAIPPTLMPELAEIRNGIRSGKLKVERNRVVKA